jgi:hypothetical protein
LYSVRVAGVGTMIQVLSSDENTGHMVVKAGKRFVAVTKAVSIAGEPKARRTLTAVAPTFFQSGVAVTYQWQVNGKPVAGATGQTYVVKRADAGKAITVVATGTKAGYDTATSISAPAGTSRSVALSVHAPKQVHVGHRIKITVTATASGATPTGKVKVKIGKQTVRGTLVDGKVRVKLPKQSTPGTKKVKVTYVPDAGFAAASETVKVRVIR